MAAIKRALILPQLLSANILHNFTRTVWDSSRRTLNARYSSRISSLQPAYPSKQDPQLFEDVNNEYATADTDVVQLPKTGIKSHPCDALAAAALEHNEELANTLLDEYRSAGIDVVLRPEYEELANLNLLKQKFDAFFNWLSLLPPVGGEGGILFPKNTHMVEQMSTIRLPFDQMYRLMYLFARKGWSGPVPNNLVSILAQYTESGEFTRLLSESMDAHRKAHGSSEEVRWIHAEWRNRAIQQYATRNDPETAFAILAQSPLDAVEFDQKVLVHLDAAATRMRYPIPAFAEQLIKTARSLPTPKRDPLRNSDISKRAFRTLFYRVNTMNPIASAKSKRETAILLGKLKWILISPRFNSNSIDPRPIAFLFYTLVYAPRNRAQAHPHILELFRKRVARLGSGAAKELWATVELELLLYIGDAHAALLYFHQTFLPLNVPSFLNSHANPTLAVHWSRWMAASPLTPLPPSPAAMLLRPSAISTMSIWKAAITLSVRDPKVVPRNLAPENRPKTLHGIHTFLKCQDDNGNTINDVSQLTDLFHDFLQLFDAQMLKQRTFFSNPFTRIRYFEPFLRRYVHLAPTYCASVMTQIQARDVPLDHRIWAIYAKSKVDAGEHGFILDVFELLQREIGQPLDFSPRAWKNWDRVGVRGDGDDPQQHIFTVPSKVLSAYAFALRQLLNVRALPEALELHRRIMEAGYQEGTSVSLDRLIYQMLEELRLTMREPRIRLSKGGRIAIEEPRKVVDIEELHDDFGDADQPI